VSVAADGLFGKLTGFPHDQGQKVGFVIAGIVISFVTYVIILLGL